MSFLNSKVWWRTQWTRWAHLYIWLRCSSPNKPMAKPLRISVWNANGLCKHTQEIIQFLQIFDIDILLISETHFTSRSCIKVPNYIVYNTLHPDEMAHGGTAIIIRQNVKHHIREEYKQTTRSAGLLHNKRHQNTTSWNHSVLRTLIRSCPDYSHHTYSHHQKTAETVTAQ